MQPKHLDFDSVSDTRSLIKKEEGVSPHFHKNFELLYIISGALETTVDGMKETVVRGEFAMILPNQVHASIAIAPTRIWACVFWEEHARRFAGCMEGKKGVSAKFTCDPATVSYLKDNVLANKLLTEMDPSFAGNVHLVTPLKTKMESLHLECAEHLFQLEACLSAICACYVKQVSLIPRKQADSTLAHRLLVYISEHYREDITLRNAAEELDYSVNYLSKCQRQILGTSFRQFLNQQRLAYAQELMRGHKMPIAEIAGQSGFGSVRNFNRVYKELTGKTPRENSAVDGALVKQKISQVI